MPCSSACRAHIQLPATATQDNSSSKVAATARREARMAGMIGAAAASCSPIREGGGGLLQLRARPLTFRATPQPNGSYGPSDTAEPAKPAVPLAGRACRAAPAAASTPRLRGFRLRLPYLASWLSPRRVAPASSPRSAPLLLCLLAPPSRHQRN